MPEPSWGKQVEKILRETRSVNQHFKKWLAYRKSDGGPFFNSPMYLKCYNIYARVNNKFKEDDYFLVISGREGTGKSTLAIQIASTVDPTFCMERVCFKRQDFLKQLKSAKPGQAIIMDEGNMFFFSREAMTEENREMFKLFTMMRQLRLFIIICVPKYFSIDSGLRSGDRINSHIYCYKGHKYTCFNEKGIRYSNDNKRVGGLKYPPGTFFIGWWNKPFPTINDISVENYKKHKVDNFGNFMDSLRKKIDNLEKKRSGAKI